MISVIKIYRIHSSLADIIVRFLKRSTLGDHVFSTVTEDICQRHQQGKDPKYIRYLQIKWVHECFQASPNSHWQQSVQFMLFITWLHARDSKVLRKTKYIVLNMFRIRPLDRLLSRWYLLCAPLLPVSPSKGWPGPAPPAGPPSPPRRPPHQPRPAPATAGGGVMPRWAM